MGTKGLKNVDMARRLLILSLVVFATITVPACANFSFSSYGSRGADHSQIINDNLQILLYVARYRDGEIANQALDAAIHITGKTDAREEAFARSLSDKDIHQIIRDCRHSRFMVRVYHALDACKPALFFTLGLFVLFRLF